ncbi:MAG: T9SS type A sorting domain-containing protein, partial [Bacteroidota bacterium]
SQKKKLSISYPNLDFSDYTLYPNNVFWGYSTPNTVNVLLKGDWQLDDPSLENVSVQLKTENGFTSFNVVLKDGLSRDIVFKYSPITAVTQMKSNEIQTIITHDLIIITVPDQEHSEVSDCKIVNMLGAIVNDFSIKGRVTTIPISYLKSGVYILCLGKNNQPKKFIKL